MTILLEKQRLQVAKTALALLQTGLVVNIKALFLQVTSISYLVSMQIEID